MFVQTKKIRKRSDFQYLSLSLSLIPLCVTCHWAWQFVCVCVCVCMISIAHLMTVIIFSVSFQALMKSKIKPLCIEWFVRMKYAHFAILLRTSAGMSHYEVHFKLQHAYECIHCCLITDYTWITDSTSLAVKCCMSYCIWWSIWRFVIDTLIYSHVFNIQFSFDENIGSTRCMPLFEFDTTMSNDLNVMFSFGKFLSFTFGALCSPFSSSLVVMRWYFH